MAVAPQTWPLALGAVAANHAMLAVASMTPRGRWLGPNLTRLAATAPGQVALTFDDGPDPEVTPRVLAALAAAGARATFFCIGARAARHPDLVKAMLDAGHGVENHTFSHHSSFALRGAASMRDDIQRGQDAIVAAGAPRPRFFRAPAGMRNPWLAGVLDREALALVSWTRRGFDTRTREPHVVARRLVQGLAAGDILLLHDGNAARTDAGAPVVLEALDQVLEMMARQGLRSVSLGVGVAPGAAPRRG